MYVCSYINTYIYIYTKGSTGVLGSTRDPKSLKSGFSVQSPPSFGIPGRQWSFQRPCSAKSSSDGTSPEPLEPPESHNRRFRVT